MLNNIKLIVVLVCLMLIGCVPNAVLPVRPVEVVTTTVEPKILPTATSSSSISPIVVSSSFSDVEIAAVTFDVRSLITKETYLVNGLSTDVYVLNSRVAGGCSPNVLEVAARAKEVGNERGIPWLWWGPMLFSESGFIQFVKSGNTCKLLQNYTGAPAYCVTQIYAPQGAPTKNHYGTVHPEYEYSKLSDLDYCLNAGADILIQNFNRSGGNWLQAIAWYKNVKGAYYASDSRIVPVLKYQTACVVIDKQTGESIDFCS